MRRPGQADARGGRDRATLVRGALVFLVVVALWPLVALGQEPPPPAAPAARSGGNFEGDWSAVGSWQTLPAGTGIKASICYFSGSLILRTPGGLSQGFRSEVITYDNGRDLSVGTCVWTDDRGDQIFSDLKGQAIASAKHIVGAITGGTGRYAGVTGEFEFDWQYVITTPEGEVQGRVSSLKGSWKRGPAPGGGSP